MGKSYGLGFSDLCGESLAMENFSEGEQEVFQEPYRIITDHYLFGCGSKWKTDVGPQMWMSSLVLAIQLLGYLILTHTHLKVKISPSWPWIIWWFAIEHHHFFIGKSLHEMGHGFRSKLLSYQRVATEVVNLYSWFTHKKMCFYIVMLNYQRVIFTWIPQLGMTIQVDGMKKRRGPCDSAKIVSGSCKGSIHDISAVPKDCDLSLQLFPHEHSWYWGIFFWEPSRDPFLLGNVLNPNFEQSPILS